MLPWRPGNEKGWELLQASSLEIWSRRQESNLDLSLRRAEFYPLKYSESARPQGLNSRAL